MEKLQSHNKRTLMPVIPEYVTVLIIHVVLLYQWVWQKAL